MNADLIRAMASDPAEYRRNLLIDCGGTLRPLAEVLDPFQEQDFLAMDRAWAAVAGLPGPEPKHRWGWVERHRGASKSQDAAVSALWLLAFSKRQVHGVCVAADQAQAGIVRGAILRLMSANDWLDAVIEVLRWEVRNKKTGSTLSIVASDEQSSWGWLIDFSIMDEVSMWPTDALWVSTISALGKKTNTVALTIMNAGWRTSWAWKLRESIREDPEWYFAQQTGHASWIGEGQLAKQRRLLSAVQYSRLWNNQWSTAQGDAFTEQQVHRLVKHEEPMWFREPQYTYGIGVDVGVECHHSSVVTVAVDHAAEHVRVALVEDFAPPVRLDDVEQAIFRSRQQFGANWLAYDPSQMISIAQNCERAGMHCEKVPPSGAGVQSRMAVSLMEAVRQQTLELYPDALLIQDILGAQIVERPQGLRVVLAENDNGHSDRLSALLQVLPFAQEAARKPKYRHYDDGLGNNLLRAMGSRV